MYLKFLSDWGVQGGGFVAHYKVLSVLSGK